MALGTTDGVRTNGQLQICFKMGQYADVQNVGDPVETMEISLESTQNFPLQSQTMA